MGSPRLERMWIPTSSSMLINVVSPVTPDVMHDEPVL